ncbi:MAG: Gfo/Idh/MocA family oxidoreductase [Armatimonadetes bacterium]|nr:Gfo/Idh/MocA family oxidoreductase [Armatimonadota bacterium]
MRLAIAGLKGHYGVAVQGLAKIKGGQLVAVADDDAEGAAALARSPVAASDFHVYEDWREMLDREEIDVLVEAGIDSERAEIVVAGLERGLPVLAEKPLACDVEQLDCVEQAVRASGACLSMLLTMRYEPLYIKLRQLVQDGAVGQVCLASMQKSYRLGQRPAWQRDRRTFSGIIPFIGVHALDLIVWTTGLRPRSGFAYQANTGHPQIGDMEDNAVVALELEGGAHADIRLDYCRPAKAPTHGDDRLRVAGGEGVIEAHGAEGSLVLVTNQREPEMIDLGQAKGDLLVEFVEAVRAGRPAPISAEEALAVTRWCLQLREGARRAERVEF